MLMVGTSNVPANTSLSLRESRPFGAREGQPLLELRSLSKTLPGLFVRPSRKREGEWILITRNFQSIYSIRKKQMKKLNIGLVGYGFMGRTHSNAYAQVSHFFKSEYQPVLKAVCARNEEKVKEFASNWGYESTKTDWRKLVQRPDIDVIDICTPNNMHKEIAIAAAKAGKMICARSLWQ